MLKLLGWVVGIALISLGAGRILFSTATILGGDAVNPAIDTETRAGGALLIALGVAYVWAVRRSPTPSALLRFLAITMALLAVARVISMIDTSMLREMLWCTNGLVYRTAFQRIRNLRVEPRYGGVVVGWSSCASCPACLKFAAQVQHWCSRT